MSSADEPAFPAGHPTSVMRKDNFLGLTKRELVAAMAMQGILSNPALTDPQSWCAKNIIKSADALLKELEKKE